MRATPQAIGLFHALRTAHARGLRDEDYEAGAITARLDELRSSAAQAQLDLAETLARLASSASLKATLDGVEPPSAHYRLLRDALARYRDLALDASLRRLPPFEQRSRKSGDSYGGTAQLRRLLAALGDLPADQASVADPFIGPELVGAIGQFQRRHGLAVDGSIGRRTFEELTRPIAARVPQIELTLERWRWLTHFDEPPIIVNIPQFRLFAFHTRACREADIVGMDVIFA